MKKGAIFDQDGLMFDTEPIFAQAWAEAGKRLGLVIPEGFHAAIAGSGGEAAKRIIREWLPEADCDALMSLTYEISYEIQSHTLTEKPGLHEILEFFRANGVKMAVASSSHRAPVERNLEKSGVRPYFEAVVCGEDLSRGKPDPEAFLTAAARLGLPPEDCYVFEDSFNGVRAGRAAGCRTVMIPDMVRPDETIARCYDACYPDLLTALEQIKKGCI